jgi:hypothetical protein
VGLTALVALAALGCGRITTVVGAELEDSAASAQSAAICAAAESAVLSGGFTVQTGAAEPGQAYIWPPPGVTSLNMPGDASAGFNLAIGEAGTYGLWGRIRAPSVPQNAFWMTVDNGPAYLWHLSTGVIWFTGPVTSGADYVHPIRFDLDAGNHRVLVQNADPGVGLERVCFAAPGYSPSDNHTPCDPPNSIQLSDGGCEPSCGSLGGNTCGAIWCAGLAPLPAYDCEICCYSPDAGNEAGGVDASPSDGGGVDAGRD